MSWPFFCLLGLLTQVSALLLLIFIFFIVPILIEVEWEIYFEGIGADDLQFRAAFATGDRGALTWVVHANDGVTEV